MTNKIMYARKEQAQEAARRSYVDRGVQLWVYVCDSCHTWHLTSRAPVEEALHGLRRSSPQRRNSWGGKPILSRKKGFKPRKH